MNKLKPMLFSNMKEYTPGQFIKDLTSGIIVAIIALPLSIALAIASGVGPEKGLYTAIVAGFLISFFGGSRVQIAGPTAAFATIVAGIVAKQGMDGLIIATVLAGLILIAMGLMRLGSLIRFIPYTITTGFTAGIAVTIFIGQWKDFFGITYLNGEAPIETLEKLSAFFENIGTFNWQAALLGLISLAILIIYPKFEKKVPPSLIAVIVGILAVKFLNMNVKTIGSLYTISNKLPTLSLPAITMEKIRAVLPNAFTIAVLAAIESLLSAVVADGMINSHHRSNMELIAQGIGNIGSALFGGIPATGAIARTAANIKSGGRTPVAGMVHSVVLVLVLVVLMPYASLIPMPTIAAILFVVAYNMCQWRPFLHLAKTAPVSDILVLVVTFLLTVIFDLVVAIEVGMIAACMLFMKHMADESQVRGWTYADPLTDPDSIELRTVPKEVRVYEISGPLFFGAAGNLARITTKDFTKVLIIRMRSVPDIDASGMNAIETLYNTCQNHGITLILSHLNPQPKEALQKLGLLEKIGEENVVEHIDEALKRAEEIIG